MFGLPLLAPPDWFPSLGTAQLFSVIVMAWIAAEIVNLFVGLRVGGLRQESDRGSLWLVGAAVLAIIALSAGMRAAGMGVVVGWPQFIGLALMTVGLGLRQWAIGTLGRHFSVAVITKTDQRLVTEGPYQWARHPAYTGALLTLFGFPLALGCWAALPLALAIGLAAYLYRARVEERALEQRFGDEYREFAHSRPRFFPGL
jgi:protein-S-isoprenylcysteine O-methyltransferase Ste14